MCIWEVCLKISEFHRQCVFSALAIVGGVDGENVLFPSAQLCGVVLPDAVDIDRVDVAQRTEQPFFTELAVVQLHKVHHTTQDRCPEECVFIDDTPINVEGALYENMAGIVFNMDVPALAESLRALGVE